MAVFNSRLKCFHQGEHTEPSLFLKSRPSAGSGIDNRLSAGVEAHLIRQSKNIHFLTQFF